jgi:hypothetical protein
MSVCCECYVLLGRGLCDELITLPEESYRPWLVVVCDQETSWMRRPWLAFGRRANRNKQILRKEYLYYFYTVICLLCFFLGRYWCTTWQHLSWLIRSQTTRFCSLHKRAFYQVFFFFPTGTSVTCINLDATRENNECHSFPCTVVPSSVLMRPFWVQEILRCTLNGSISSNFMLCIACSLPSKACLIEYSLPLS